MKLTSRRYWTWIYLSFHIKFNFFFSLCFCISFNAGTLIKEWRLLTWAQEQVCPELTFLWCQMSSPTSTYTTKPINIDFNCNFSINTLITVCHLFQETSSQLKTKRLCLTQITSPYGTKGQQNKFLEPLSTLYLSTQVSYNASSSAFYCHLTYIYVFMCISICTWKDV